MYFRLAALTGCATVDEFLDRNTSSQLSEWLAYANIDLLPQERHELLLASIASILANQWRGEDDTPVNPQDFMPWQDIDDDDTGDDQPDMIAIIENLNAAFGGEDLRNRDTVNDDTGDAGS